MLRLPLFEDLHKQQKPLIRFAWKAILLVVLFLAVDRGVGLFLTSGLKTYYGLDRPAEILCIGHSQTVLGIDKVELEKRLGMKVAKYAVEGANTADRFVMLRHYLSEHPKSVRAVLMGVDAHLFAGAGLSSASYTLLFPFIDDPEVRPYIKANCKTGFEYWLRRVLMSTRFGEMPLSLAIRGHTRNWANLKFGKVNIPNLEKDIGDGRFRRIAFVADNLRVFAQTLRYARERDIQVVLVYIPTVDVLNHVEPQLHRKAVSIFQSYAAADPGIVFLDYNQDYENRHELFFDSIHLNPQGQDLVTNRLAADLRQVLANNQARLNATKNAATN
jgi:hypothetical protein